MIVIKNLGIKVALIGALTWLAGSPAVQAEESVCAVVKIEILQELTWAELWHSDGSFIDLVAENIEILVGYGGALYFGKYEGKIERSEDVAKFPFSRKYTGRH